MQEENFETYFLVWLDNSDKNPLAKQKAQDQLRSSINYVKRFSDEQQCESYIRSLSNDDRVIFIANAQLGKNLIPEIHPLPQVTSIYVFCVDKSKYQAWANQFKKIKCLISQYNELVAQIEYDQQRRSLAKIDEPLSISILNVHLANVYNNNTEEYTSAVDYEFVYSYHVIDCLLNMKSLFTDRHEFLKLCESIYKQNDGVISTIGEFRREYNSSKSFFWITRYAFIQKLINKALRVRNFQILMACRFFFQDIYQELAKRKCVKSVRLYRSHQLSTDELDLLKASVGKIISINSFLLANLNRKQSISYFRESVLNKNYHHILFEIEADPRLNDARPFGNITSLSYSTGEQIVLFMAGSLFQIVQIQQDDNPFVVIQLKLCSRTDEQLTSLKFPDQFDFISFGQLLIDKKNFEQARIYYNYLVRQMTDEHPDVVICYDALGYVLSEKKQYSASLKSYEKALAIKMSTLDPDDPRIAYTHNSIAAVHLNSNDYEHALESYEKALAILQQKLGEDHIRIADCLNNIAMVHKIQKQYHRALNLYNRVLSIQKTHLSDNNLELALTYNNIGLVHGYLLEFDQALENFTQSLKIYESVLPREHCLISMTLENIANIHYDKADLRQALSYYERASTMNRHLLPLTHPDVLQVKLVIKRLQSKLT